MIGCLLHLEFVWFIWKCHIPSCVSLYCMEIQRHENFFSLCRHFYFVLNREIVTPQNVYATTFIACHWVLLDGRSMTLMKIFIYKIYRREDLIYQGPLVFILLFSTLYSVYIVNFMPPSPSFSLYILSLFVVVVVFYSFIFYKSFWDGWRDMFHFICVKTTTICRHV